MTDILHAAVFEQRRRRQRGEPVDAPYYITDADAQEIARQAGVLGRCQADAVYQEIVTGTGTLYDMVLVVRD